MKLLRSVAGIAAGYINMAVIVIVATPIAVKLLLSRADAGPTTLYLAVNLLYSGVAAACGGYVAGFIARRAPVVHAAILGVLLAGTSAATGFAPEPGQPRWYPFVIAAIGVAGALAGGLLRLLQTNNAVATNEHL